MKWRGLKPAYSSDQWFNDGSMMVQWFNDGNMMVQLYQLVIPKLSQMMVS